MMMNIVEKILRYSLAGFVIVSAGDVFFRFLEKPAPPEEAQEFLISLTATGYIWPAVGGVFLVSGILFCIRKFVGLATVILFPVSANILLFTLFLDRSCCHGVSGVVLCLLQLFVAVLNRGAFRSLIGR